MPETKIEIDVAGGRGEYFVEKARKERGKVFLLLDPVPAKILRKPANLNVFRWISSKRSALPITKDSVDEANVNFLFGEIRDENDEVYSDPTQFEEYRRVSQEIFRVLKPNGTLKVVDARANIFNIKDLLIDSGFGILEEPRVISDGDRTVWTKVFFDVYKNVGKPLEKSEAAPMEITVVKKPLDRAQMD